MVKAAAGNQTDREQQEASATAPVTQVQDAFLAAMTPQSAPPWPEDAFRYMFKKNCMDVMVSRSVTFSCHSAHSWCLFQAG